MESKENEILRIFFAKDAMQLPSSELYKEASERGISSTTFYRWLDQLIQKGILRKERITRKNILYHLNVDALPRDMAIIFELQNKVLEEINAKMRSLMEKFDEVECFKQLAYWIGALTLYTAYEANLDGRLEYMEIPAYYIRSIAGAYSHIGRAMIARVEQKAMQDRPYTSDEMMTWMHVHANHKIPWDELYSRTELKKEYYDQAKLIMEEVFDYLDSKVFEDGKIKVIRKLFEGVKSGRSMREEARWLAKEIIEGREHNAPEDWIDGLKRQLMNLVKQFPEMSKDEELAGQIKRALKDELA
jgi:Fe2+ or Zn2+ uptake regulation protein